MIIVLDDEVVGELTDDGEIVTEDLWLKKLADRIKRRQLAVYGVRRAARGNIFIWLRSKKVIPSTIV